MKIEAILEKEFHHEGRGPELQKVIWGGNGVVLKGFEYYNPEDTYDEEHIKNISLEKVEAFSMASDEVHSFIVANGETQAAIHKIVNSEWKKQFSPIHTELRRNPNIQAAELRDRTVLRVEVKPDEWLPLWLYSVDDFEQLSVAKFFRQRGSFSPNAESIIIERNGLLISDFDIGSIVRVQSEGKVIETKLSGIVLILVRHLQPRISLSMPIPEKPTTVD